MSKLNQSKPQWYAQISAERYRIYREREIAGSKLKTLVEAFIDSDDEAGALKDLMEFTARSAPDYDFVEKFHMYMKKRD